MLLDSNAKIDLFVDLLIRFLENSLKIEIDSEN
jgi:hypothetical protein